jgi:hypothetical protein
MKLIGSLIAVAFAQDGYNPAPEDPTDAPAPAPVADPNWPGQAAGGVIAFGSSCGSQAFLKANPVNATCTLSFNGLKPAFVSVAGSFPLPAVGKYSFTGFEGISNAETQDVLVFWDQQVNDLGEPDNSTTGGCGLDTDISVSCEDYGGAWMTPNLVSNFAHDPRQTSFSVGVMNHDDSFTMDMGAGWSNATSDHATCTTSGDTLACPLGPDSSAGNLAYCRFSGSARSNY